MKWRDLLEQWGLTSLKVKLPFLELEWEPIDEDRAAAWELYVELLTRIATQPLSAEHGDEKTALDSVFSLFAVTRQVLKANSRKCIQFAKIAIIVLNQVVRPFTAKWHKRALAGAFSNPGECQEFRRELGGLQAVLRNYTRMLADMAGVEDITSISPDE